MLLLVSELNHIFIAKALQVVHFDDSLKDGEAMLDVREVVIPVDVDSMNLDLITGASDVDQVVKDEDFFLAGDTARGHCAWCLLNCQLLIVAIQRLHLIYLVWATLVAHDTLGQTRFCCIWVSIEDGSLEVTTLAAEVHLGVLWEDLRALGHDSAELDEGVQMNLAQFSDLVLNGQLCDSHKDLLMVVDVVWVDLLHDLTCDRVQDRDHVSWLFGKPNGKIGRFRSQFSKVDLERLLVLAAHVLDAVLIDMNAFFGEASQELLEGPLDERDDLLFLDPLGQGLFSLTVVVDHLHVSKVTLFVVGISGCAHHARLASPCVVLLA